MSLCCLTQSTNDMLPHVLLATLVVSCASQTLDDRFCNETIKTPFKTSCRSCSMNKYIACPDGSTKLTSGQGEADCVITVQLMKKYVLKLTGCRHTCERTAVIASCCQGYWGPDCRACPGGADKACSGHGNCSDGVRGNGTCYSCDNDFTGYACEICANSSHYGPNCSAVCKCVHGFCNAGIQGDGTCTCETGYEGKYCDETITSCDAVDCHENARCTITSEGPVCVCKYGFEGNGSNCQPVDRCTEVPPICHAHATCAVTGPALFQCQCIHGYRGDGFMCVPIDPCQQASFGECPLDTTQCVYEGPGQRSCHCLDGYDNYIDGVGCTLIDVCLTNNTCHAHANCTTVAPKQIDCICEEGYIGDGQTCYGNIIQRLQELHASDPKLSGQFVYMLRLMKFAYRHALTAHGPFTLFVSTDRAFHSARISNKVFEIKNWGRQLLRQHIIAAQLTLSDLTNATEFYTLEGNSAELLYKNDELKYKLHGLRKKSVILKGDIIAANGIIHVIDGLMDKPPAVIGSHKETLATLIKTTGRYNKFEELLDTIDLGNLLDEPETMVVFAPQNRAWDAFAPGTLDYLMSQEVRFIPEFAAILRM
ncbi:hypothetical protein NP493_1121g00007 [Ridgeia piscesae]|uniref:Stabilin-2-like n=1 Tax=Ridgeia piscesae TaxID=27915 RepID=A0AAD9KGT8_RIDPI|nr:hypothetical protein NP493_1121g00007 [Ridgeia piscesae]